MAFSQSVLPKNVNRFALNSAATTNATSIKSTPAAIFSGHFANSGGTVAYVKLYDKQTAPTVGTDAPFMVITVPANDSARIDLGVYGFTTTKGLGLAITGLATDADATAVAAGQVKVALSFA